MAIQIFSDGACFGNPGPGAFATLIRFEDGREKVLTGYEPQTTNNRMELRGVITGLAYFTQPISCLVVTDSQYVSKGITEWMPKWVKNHWRSKVTRTQIKNLDLWQQLYQLTQTHTVRLKWVRGHAGHPENERCNDIAQHVIRKKKSS